MTPSEKFWTELLKAWRSPWTTGEIVFTFVLIVLLEIPIAIFCGALR